MELNKKIINELNNFGKSFVEDLRDNLLSKEKSETKSRLSASIKTLNTVYSDGVFKLQIEINDYYTFVDKGRGKGGVSKEGQAKIGEWGASRGYIGKFQTNELKRRLEKQRENKTNKRKNRNYFQNWKETTWNCASCTK